MRNDAYRAPQVGAKQLEAALSTASGGNARPWQRLYSVIFPTATPGSLLSGNDAAAFWPWFTAKYPEDDGRMSGRILVVNFTLKQAQSWLGRDRSSAVAARDKLVSLGLIVPISKGRPGSGSLYALGPLPEVGTVPKGSSISGVSVPKGSSISGVSVPKGSTERINPHEMAKGSNNWVEGSIHGSKNAGRRVQEMAKEVQKPRMELDHSHTVISGSNTGNTSGVQFSALSSLAEALNGYMEDVSGRYISLTAGGIEYVGVLVEEGRTVEDMLRVIDRAYCWMAEESIPKRFRLRHVLDPKAFDSRLRTWKPGDSDSCSHLYDAAAGVHTLGDDWPEEWR